jgi:hypothetical protein
METINAIINVEYQRRSFIYTDRHTDTHTHTDNLIFSLSDKICYVFMFWGMLQWSVPKTNFVFVIHKHLAESISNTLKSC